MIRKLPNRQRVLLQVIVQEGFCSKTAMRAFSGYSYGGTDLALVELKQLGLVYQHFSCGIHCATEHGKIVLALLIGQETKQSRIAFELRQERESRFRRELRYETLREFGRRLKQQLDAEFGCGSRTST